MKGHVANSQGDIAIDNEVMAKYAGSAAIENFGIVGMASVSMKDGLVRLLKKESVSRGVNVVVDEENKLQIDLHIIVAYGVNINSVCENLIGNVKYRVEEFTGMEVSKISVLVEGVRVVD
ncbi:MAG: Asp23/Gls24 family envelope stress response protein [Lachnospiraceae bacterium]|jgi:uncharacterized alkaline shock family protein YloU|nr:Asp23/Gls24 family envelope stress response protein [Lachnospiraceae bacterium]MBQ5561101.1 Asp23/Gls24 family envelope stress response protein [Lachnospiraceae bacterium]MCR4803905.1 Asp23/Gls24 family envelope stress response protein [Lachnospiraceae bacterium]